MVESSSNLDVDQVDVSAFADIPFLFVYGDFLGDEYCIDGYKWPGALAWEGSMRRLRERVLEMGGDSTWLELPDLGIRGNTRAHAGRQQLADRRHRLRLDSQACEMRQPPLR